MTSTETPLSFGNYQLGPLALQTLIYHGQRRGGITRADILDAVPDAEFDDGLFEAIRSRLGQAGISYAEETSREESPLERFNDEVEALEALAQKLPPDEDILADIEADNMIRMYLREATRTPLLTAEQEVTLARLIENCKFAQEELNRGVDDPQRRKELQEQIERGQQARDHLIQANARLVVSVAKHYDNNGLPLLDLIQEGNIGLMRAVRSFDYKRGFRFSTYATWYIRQSITRSLADQGRLVRIPAYLSDQIVTLRRHQTQLQQRLGRPPTIHELAETANLPPARVEQMLEVSRQPLSLQSPVGEAGEDELGEMLSDTATPDPEEAVVQTLSSEDVRRQLADLPERERELLEMRFGIAGDEPMSLAEIGQRLGISRERARQLEAQALKRLREPNGKRRRGPATGAPRQRPPNKTRGSA
jgi:RNA polymerase primary sigma factor